MSTTFDGETRVSLLIAAGDPANQKARDAFTERYAGLIRTWCCRMGLQGADQEDVVQTILCRLIAMLPTFRYDPNKRFRGLLRTMIHHAIVDLHRNRQRAPGGHGSGDSAVLDLLHEAPAPDDASVEDLVQELAGHTERLQRLRAACERVRARVAPHTWQAFWLTTVECRPTADVAQELAMKNGTVLVFKGRVIKMIRLEIDGAA
jgi:RNA polymerase sigma-70 factor (ECF subfamily)